MTDWITKKDKKTKMKKDMELARSLHPDYDLETASWITKKKSKRVGTKTPKLPKNTAYDE